MEEHVLFEEQRHYCALRQKHYLEGSISLDLNKKQMAYSNYIESKSLFPVGLYTKLWAEWKGTEENIK